MAAMKKVAVVLCLAYGIALSFAMTVRSRLPWRISFSAVRSVSARSNGMGKRTGQSIVSNSNGIAGGLNDLR